MTTMANRHADQFCDLSGFDPNSARPVLFAHDGSDITLIEIKGARSIISENDFADRMIDTFAAEMAQVMKAPSPASVAARYRVCDKCPASSTMAR